MFRSKLGVRESALGITGVLLVVAATAACSAPGEARVPSNGDTVAHSAGGVSSGATTDPGRFAGPVSEEPTIRSAVPTSQGSPAVAQLAVLQSLPGSAKNVCVPVASRPDIRSGSLAAGNFVDARKTFAKQIKTKSQPEISLYLIPASGVMGKLTVTLTPLKGGASRTASSTAVNTADRWKYYSLTVALPAAGLWRLSAVAGPDRGCFDVEFGS